MTDRDNHSGPFNDLRQKAEKLLREKMVDTSSYPGDILQLVHELHVYQTELEIQNEELKSAQQEFSELRHEYEALYEFAPCGFVLPVVHLLNKQEYANHSFSGAGCRAYPGFLLGQELLEPTGDGATFLQAVPGPASPRVRYRT